MVIDHDGSSHHRYHCTQCGGKHFIALHPHGFNEKQEQRKDGQPVETKASCESGSQDQKQDSTCQGCSCSQDPRPAKECEEELKKLAADYEDLYNHAHALREELAEVKITLSSRDASARKEIAEHREAASSWVADRRRLNSKIDGYSKMVDARDAENAGHIEHRKRLKHLVDAKEEEIKQLSVGLVNLADEKHDCLRREKLLQQSFDALVAENAQLLAKHHESLMLLLEIRTQILDWVDESYAGSWSTNHVEAQRRLATAIYRQLHYSKD